MPVASGTSSARVPSSSGTDRSGSPRAGFGSVAGHGSRSPASTLPPCRSVWTSADAAEPVNSRAASMAASAKAAGTGDPSAACRGGTAAAMSAAVAAVSGRPVGTPTRA